MICFVWLVFTFYFLLHYTIIIQLSRINEIMNLKPAVFDFVDCGTVYSNSYTERSFNPVRVN